MNNRIKQKKYIYAFIFLLIFNFSDIIIYSSSDMHLNLITLVTFLIPVIYAIYHINNDEERLPTHLCYLGIITSTIYLFSEIINEVLYFVLFELGDQNVSVIYDHRYILFLFILLIVFILSKIRLPHRLIHGGLGLIFITSFALIIYVTVFMFTNDAATIIVGDFGMKYLMECFLPILFLIFIKFERREYKLSVIAVSITYSLLVIFIVILSNTIFNSPLNDMFIQQLYIQFLYSNFNIQIAFILLIINSLNMLYFSIVCFSLIREYVIDQKKLSVRNVQINTILTVLIVSTIALYYTYDTNSLITLVHNVLIVAQTFLLVGTLSFSFYLGIKKYMTSSKKFGLFLLSTFPLIYTAVYLYILQNPIITLASNVNKFLNSVFLVFSLLVLLYYTLETISLYYAYTKRLTTASIEQCVVEKKLHIYVMIPCMNEDLVINSTVRSVLNNDYPNLHINVIDDASEDETANEVLKIKDPRLNLMQRIKPNAQIGKGEALNWAYYQLIEEINQKEIAHEDVLITIIDADTDVDSDYFYKVNYVFNSRRHVTGLQSKVRVIDLEQDSAQDLEFAEIINSSQSLRNLTGTVAFGGNGQFCRLSTLESLDEQPWSKSLVEDFDLSTRLFLQKGSEVQNIQIDDIYIRQTGIKKDPAALVKQRVRWAQGNVQSSIYIKPIIKSKLLEPKQKIELLSTLIKPWMMAIEYLILIYTMVVIADTIIFSGLTRAIAIIIILFFIMALYILFINLIWAILYNRKNNKKLKIKLVIRDVFYLTKFLLTLTQIYPQSIIRYFKSENGWDKTKRQEKK